MLVLFLGAFLGKWMFCVGLTFCHFMFLFFRLVPGDLKFCGFFFFIFLLDSVSSGSCFSIGYLLSG